MSLPEELVRHPQTGSGPHFACGLPKVIELQSKKLPRLSAFGDNSKRSAKKAVWWIFRFYTIKLRDPAGHFLASSFEMRNETSSASNAFSVESTKFMTYLSSINTTIQAHPRRCLAEYHPRHWDCPQCRHDGATTIVAPTATP
jgi:hypothetical protein